MNINNIYGFKKWGKKITLCLIFLYKHASASMYRVHICVSVCEQVVCGMEQPYASLIVK